MTSQPHPPPEQPGPDDATQAAITRLLPELPEPARLASLTDRANRSAALDHALTILDNAIGYWTNLAERLHQAIHEQGLLDIQIPHDPIAWQAARTLAHPYAPFHHAEESARAAATYYRRVRDQVVQELKAAFGEEWRLELAAHAVITAHLTAQTGPDQQA